MDDRDFRPLYEVLRPKTVDDIVGQPHLVGENGIISIYLKQDKLFSMLFYGPPGTGKTTLARLISDFFHAKFLYFNAVEASTVEIKKTIREECNEGLNILFVDEIHRFNKNQQTIFLPHMESGRIVLIATTTENPGYTIISPLRSRMRVVPFKKLGDDALLEIVEKGLSHFQETLEADIKQLIVDYADGDGRFALFLLEEVMSLMAHKKLSAEELQETLNKKMLLSDKKGDFYYNYLSALHKSLRGSDADAAVYWICAMMESGIDPLAILRRMTAMASEDIGFADPNALRIVNEATRAYEFLGFPEGRMAIIQAAVYLALAPKSNSVLKAMEKGLSLVREHGVLNIPDSIASNTKRYRYPHAFEDPLIRQDYLPKELEGEEIVTFIHRGKETNFKNRWETVRPRIRKKK
ncbi:MAG TPA: replication-associated recombination protein A [Candidatus Mcinerneyibacteriales bacterium]|nr:replication-associated recombination protein A [Candidatus Mcinerneyibacteriales bacterium]